MAPNDVLLICFFRVIVLAATPRFFMDKSIIIGGKLLTAE